MYPRLSKANAGVSLPYRRFCLNTHIFLQTSTHFPQIYSHYFCCYLVYNKQHVMQYALSVQSNVAGSYRGIK